MIRDILFKARSYKNEWIEGYFWHNYFENYFIRRTFRPLDEYFTVEDIEVDPETVCQYSGCLDIKKNKLFENDIVKSPANIWKVVFANGMFLLVDKNNQWTPLGTFFMYCEKIGNIFDNPELFDNEE